MVTLKNVGRKVSLFVLTIRNKSLYSGNIITYLKIERMSLNLLTTLPKKITDMKIICSGVDGIKAELWEAITRYRTGISENGLRGRIEMGLLLWKPFCVKKGGTLPLKTCILEAQNTFSHQNRLKKNMDTVAIWKYPEFSRFLPS